MGCTGFTLFISLNLTFTANQADFSVQHRGVGRGLQSLLSAQCLEMEEETAAGFLGWRVRLAGASPVKCY